MIDDIRFRYSDIESIDLDSEYDALNTNIRGFLLALINDTESPAVVQVKGGYISLSGNIDQVKKYGGILMNYETVILSGKGWGQVFHKVQYLIAVVYGRFYIMGDSYTLKIPSLDVFTLGIFNPILLLKSIAITDKPLSPQNELKKSTVLKVMGCDDKQWGVSINDLRTIDTFYLRTNSPLFTFNAPLPIQVKKRLIKLSQVLFGYPFEILDGVRVSVCLGGFTINPNEGRLYPFAPLIDTPFLNTYVPLNANKARGICDTPIKEK